MTEPRFPNLFVVGAPKCGTTSLAYWLGQHPDIFATLEKEPCFFGSDIVFSGERLSLPRYEAHYRSWKNEKYALDATPVYFVSERAAEEIHSASSDAEIVIVLRNPVEAVHSCFHHARFRLTETLETLEEGLEAEADRKRDHQAPRFGALQSLLYVDIYRYRRNILRYLDAFGEKRVHIVLLEDFQRDPRQTLGNLLVALAIDSGHADRIDLTVKNEAGRARSKAATRLATHPPEWAGWVTKPFVSRETRTKVRAWIRKVNTVPSKNPPLLPETRRRLIEQFRPDVEWLSSYLNRDLSHWIRES